MVVVVVVMMMMMMILFFFSIASSPSMSPVKRMLLIRTKHNMRIFGVIPFMKLQNDT